MKREKEVPAELIAYLNMRNQQIQKAFDKLNMLYTIPVRAVRMKMLVENGRRGRDEDFRTAVIPPVDIYIKGKAMLKKDCFKRDALSYFIAGTKKAFPFGHVYDGSGSICLGSIFVPSAVPERSATMPLETLFLHNDRNLSHGNSHLHITKEQADQIKVILDEAEINLDELAQVVINNPGEDIIRHDGIWSLSADVADQKPLPVALHIMSEVYKIVFMYEKKPEIEEKEAVENG